MKISSTTSWSAAGFLAATFTGAVLWAKVIDAPVCQKVADQEAYEIYTRTTGKFVARMSVMADDGAMKAGLGLMAKGWSPFNMAYIEANTRQNTCRIYYADTRERLLDAPLLAGNREIP